MDMTSMMSWWYHFYQGFQRFAVQLEIYSMQKLTIMTIMGLASKKPNHTRSTSNLASHNWT